MENRLPVDHVYICHWKKLTERKAHVETELSNSSIINYTFVENYDTDTWDRKKVEEEFPCAFDKNKHRLGMTLKDSEISLLSKHCWVIRDAIAKEYKSILILEDDVVFDVDFVNKLNQCNRILPTDWDIIWVGACGSKIKSKSSRRINKCDQSRCTHCYMLSMSGMNKIQDELENISDAIDWYFNYLIEKYKLKSYCINPPLACQSANFISSIQE